MTMAANGLAKLLEELGELSQVCAKKLAYYHTDEHPDRAGSLRERMQEEIADVAAAMLFVELTFALDADAIGRRVYHKFSLFQQWHADDSNGATAFDAAGEK